MKIKSRKQARKELRKAKKLKKHEFFSKKKPRKGGFVQTKEIETVTRKVEKVVNKDNKRKEFINPQQRLDYEREKEKKQKDKLEVDIRKQRIKQLKEDNLKEDAEIRKLEKQLKMKKGKSKAFAFDGLDYLLDICDKTNTKNAFEETLQGSDSEFESDLENIVGEPKKTKKEPKSKKQKKEEELEEVESELEEEMEDSEMGECEEESELENSEESESEDEHPMKKKPEKSKNKIERESFEEEDNENEEEESKEDEEKSEKPKVWEDIYGRTRDEKGNIIKTYTPPHLRKKTEEGNTNEKLTRLKKQLKGLLNRLSESNMTFISNQIEQLYMSNSRNDMNETLCNLFTDSLMTEVLTPERLITEHAMLIAILYANIGTEIGAHFLQYFVSEFCKLLESNPEVEDKRINNVLMFILQLYNFQLFHSKLMYDIINELLKNLEEKQIELLLTTLRTVGFSLRKDDPLALKSLVVKVQEKANAMSSTENSSRVKFMLEVLMAIKNNNMSKIPNYNPELVEKMRKSIKVLVRKGNYTSELSISLQDLLNAEKHGRWWIVGSAWSGSAPSQPEANKSKPETSTEFSQKLLDLAKKQRMNTDVRRNIFCILMSAEDFLEAFEKLLKLKLKGGVEREIMNVILHCALQEKNFNLYYVYLANKFCSFDRKYQMMLQCSVWDKIKEIKNSKPIQVTNLAKFVGNVILEKGLPISILKVIQFSDLDKPTIKFMRQVLLTILFNEDKSVVRSVFTRISESSKLKLFRESLRLFLQHFVLKNATKNIEEEKISRLTEMVKIAEQALTSSDSSMIF